MADGWLGSIEPKFLARGGFDIGSHQVQTKGRVKGGRLSTDSPEWLVLYGSINNCINLLIFIQLRRRCPSFAT